MTEPKKRVRPGDGVMKGRIKELILQGCTRQQIIAKLNISDSTYDVHKRELNQERLIRPRGKLNRPVREYSPMPALADIEAAALGAAIEWYEKRKASQEYGARDKQLAAAIETLLEARENAARLEAAS